MRFYVGVTDRQWFDFLAARRPDEVNFWRPGGATPFRALEPGAPFLFKLHSPDRFVVGGGFFVGYSALPLSLAWRSFAEKNGVANFPTFQARIQHYRERAGRQEADPTIGCIVLTNPFFFPRELWIPEPADWSRNLVQGRGYDTGDPIGATLWGEVQERLQARGVTESAVVGEQPRTGAWYLAQARLGQGAFRMLVTDAYHRRCAVTGERTLPVLEAGHILPYAQNGPNLVDNGILLRADLHILFDQGYVTVTPDLHVEVSPRIKAEFDNGRAYYALHGRTLAILPDRPSDRPARAWLDWHNTHVFRP